MNKLFPFLNNFSKTELKKFQEMVGAVYFNKRKDVQQLLYFYLKNTKKQDELALFQMVYPDKPFSKTEWHLLCSRLFKLGEQFLTLQELDTQKTTQKILLSTAYRKRKQPVFYKSAYAAAEKLLDNQPIQDAQFWKNKHAIANDFYDFISSHNRKHKTNLQEVNDRLDAFYLTNKLKTACLAYARKTINQETYEIHFLANILDFLETHQELAKIPSIQVYHLCYQVITNQENEQLFTELRHAIATHQHRFQRTEQRDIFLFATNYCIRRLNEGKAIYIREAFELYRLSLDAGFLLEDGVMPESTFSNIVSLAVKLKEYDWASTFLEDNRQLLKPVFQLPLYHFCKGRLLYESGNLDDSMRHLAQVDTKTGFLLLGTKVLQLKIYYEQEEFDSLTYLLDSLRVYLQRRKDLGYRKRNYEQLIYFFKKLIEIPFQSKTKKAVFIKELQAVEGFSEKEWMLRMANG